MRHFGFRYLKQIKEVIANGHEKLNRHMIAETYSYYLPKIIKIG